MKGNASSKYLSTGVTQDVLLTQNNASFWIYVSQAVSSTNTESLGGAGQTFLSKGATSDLLTVRCTTNTTVGTGRALEPGLVGVTRNSPTSLSWVNGTQSGQNASTSAAPGANLFTLFGPTSPCRSRFAMYGIGASIDLIALRAACNAFYAGFGGVL